MRDMNTMDWITWTLVIIGALNWGLVGIFDFNLVAALFGEESALSRIVYTLVGLSGLYLVFRLSQARSGVPAKV
jgi:hypothetical protein